MTEKTDADDAPWLNPAEAQAWVRFSGMLLALLSALDTQMRRDAKLSLFGYSVLAGLSQAPGRTLTMGRVAVLASGSLSRASHAVSKLEASGWVTRHPDPDNRRIVLVTLTEEGYQKVVASAPAHVETVRRLVIDQLTPRQFNQLGKTSEVILTQLIPPGERPPWGP